MHSPDALFEIAVRSNLDVLKKLYLTSLSEQVASLISNNAFWHRRTEWLVARELSISSGVNWAQVYESLRQAQLFPESALTEVTRDLDSLLVYLKVYGPLDTSSPELIEDIWRDVASPEALEFLLNTDVIVYDVTMASTALEVNVEYGIPEMVTTLLDLLGVPRSANTIGSDVEQHVLDNCLIEASGCGWVDVLNILLSRVTYAPLVIKREFDLAVKNSSWDVAKLFLPLHPITAAEKKQLIKQIDDEPEMLMLFYETDRGFFRGKHRDGILDAAMRARGEKLTRTLDDPRIDLMSCITHIAEACTDTELGNEWRSALLSNTRLQTEKLAAQQVQLLYRENTRTRAYTELSGMGLLDVVMTAKSVYDQILRFIVLKEPSAVELLDWMIGLEDRTLEEAALSALGEHINDRHWSDVEPIRDLFLSLLRPTLECETSEAGRVLIGMMRA